jgi:hypothetical protein
MPRATVDVTQVQDYYLQVSWNLREQRNGVLALEAWAHETYIGILSRGYDVVVVSSRYEELYREEVKRYVNKGFKVEVEFVGPEAE